MTPEVGESVVETALETAGVDTIEEMADLARKHKNQAGYEGRKEKEFRALKAEIEEIKGKQQEQDLGIGDEASDFERKMARKVLELESKVTSLTHEAATEPGDKALEPYYDRVLTEHPEVREIGDPVARMRVSRRLARDMKAETEGGSGPSGDRVSDTTVAHLTGGGSQVSQRTSVTEEKALEKYEAELAAAKGTQSDAINAKYRTKYPHWNI